jgi:hypothetical protein
MIKKYVTRSQLFLTLAFCIAVRKYLILPALLLVPLMSNDPGYKLGVL